MSALQVLHPGGSTTAQDLGVRGRAHLGMSLGGAFDRRSLALANRAVGNADQAMGLEVLLQGPRLQARAPCLVAWCGAPFEVDIDGVAVPPLVARPLAVGQVLRVGRCAVGARCALAFAGGLDAPRGSAVGRHGVLALCSPPSPLTESASPPPSTLPPLTLPEGPMPVRVTDSTHSELFSPESRAALCAAPFVVASSSDRRGVRLTGRGLSFPRRGEVLTEGVTLGAVQVTRSGEAIILGVDQTTTGGYPKIAHVIAADRWRIGQLRPGAAVRFEHVSFEQARRIWLEGDRCG